MMGVEELRKNKDVVQYMHFDGDNVRSCKEESEEYNCIAMNGKYDEYLDDVKANAVRSYHPGEE